LRGKPASLAAGTMLSEAARRRFDVDARAAACGRASGSTPRREGREARLVPLLGTDPGSYNKGSLAMSGVDSRDPTSDRALVEFCLSVPSEVYLHGGRPRGLARLALADRLPPAVVSERRKGYQAADWHEAFEGARAGLREEVERILACPAAASVIDDTRMRAALDDWPDGGWDRQAVRSRYAQALLRGLSAGHFIRKAAQPEN
jgi:asparagine synthase (glutamine-hydrolysing)